jgi:hypothetical protein
MNSLITQVNHGISNAAVAACQKRAKRVASQYLTYRAAMKMIAYVPEDE